MKFQIESTGIFTVSGFLNPEECDHWISMSENTGYEEAKINSEGQQIVKKAIRNNERLIYEDFALADDLWIRVAPFVPKEIEYGIACGLNERFRFYKYLPGHRFKPHKDGSFMRSIHEWSSYTFMVYLNDDVSGGETKFSDCTIIPETGKALIFKHELLHEGCPVIEGMKYVLRSDIMFRRKKTK